MKHFVTFGRPPSSPVQIRQAIPDWQGANPSWIERALAHACAKSSGGWAVLDASDRIRTPRRFVVGGRALVAWRSRAGLRVGPDECPHMGASLCEGRVDREGRVVCPWHGVHFHPHSFLRLSVISQQLDQITVRVVYRVLGPLGMEVDARFHCPDPRTIVMTIVSGEGVGSVVETHATPIDEGRTAVVEATLATSERFAFPAFMLARRLWRPLIESRAGRLWVEDLAYAERTYALRQLAQRKGSDAMKPRGGTE